MFAIITLLGIIARLVFTIVTTILFIIVLSAYLRLRSHRILLITIGFGLFFLHALISIPELINTAYNREFTDSLHLLMDSTGLVFILLGTLHDALFKPKQE